MGGLRFDPSTDLQDRIKRIRLVAFDFDGVFTDNTVIVSEDGKESVRCNRSDGIGLRKLEKLGIKPMIISTEPNPVVAHRAKKLAVDCLHDCKDKKAALDEICRKNNLRLSEVSFVGNDVNDLSCLQIVGLPIVVQDAHPDVLSSGVYRTEFKGGCGAVREICDLFEYVLGETPAKVLGSLAKGAKALSD